MNKKVFAILVVLIVLAMACVCPALQFVGNTPSVNNPPADTAVPNLQSTFVPPASSVLFHDDFSDVNSGWDRSHYPTYSTDYENGGYRINIIPDSFSVFANPYQSFQDDVRIEVDAKKIGGPDANTFGVQCRYQDLQNFYYFYISSDGYAGIGIFRAGTGTIISSSDGSLVADSNINLGTATNHIRADCIGNTLTLFVNGTQAATATDGTFTGGDIGLISKTQSVGGTDIMFDNIFVYKP